MASTLVSPAITQNTHCGGTFDGATDGFACLRQDHMALNVACVVHTQYIQIVEEWIASVHELNREQDAIGQAQERNRKKRKYRGAIASLAGLDLIPID
jgi:hypothetical protein